MFAFFLVYFFKKGFQDFLSLLLHIAFNANDILVLDIKSMLFLNGVVMGKNLYIHFIIIKQLYDFV